MMRGQSAVEYLLMIVVALTIVAIIIAIMHNVKIAGNIAGEDVVIAYVEYNPPGNDVLGEYVLIKNEGLVDVDMSGWQLKDEQNHVYTFPNGFILEAGASVKVHTGPGNDTNTDLYWGRRQAVWNNNGDTAYLYDAEGHLVDKCSWTGHEGGAISCH